MGRQGSVAILGAGMAGATAARKLANAGLHVSVLDKGRAVGGRMATRRHETLQFDHGAQFMRAHGEAFAAQLADWEVRGIVASWAGEGRRVGVPDMNAPVRALLEGLPVTTAVTITSVRREGTAWHLADAAGATYGPFDAVAITCPAPQVTALLKESGYALPAVERASYAPCWSLMVATDAEISETLIEPRANPIGLIACDASKPGRPKGGRLTVHATPDWSRAHLEEPREAIVAALLEAAERHLGKALKPTYAAAHRWRYAQVERAVDVPCLYNPHLRLGAAGDWCLGARIEAAYDSGSALADALLADLGAAA